MAGGMSGETAGQLQSYQTSGGRHRRYSDAGWVQWLRAGGQWDEWAEDTFDQVGFAIHALRLEENSTVLNLSCGWGRHAIAMAHYRINVVGLDTSRELLDLANETSVQVGTSVSWVRGDLSDLSLSEPLDAVVQFQDNLLEWTKGPADAVHSLDRLHAILKPGGGLLFGTNDWTATLPRHQESQAETEVGIEQYRDFFNPDSRILRSQTIVVGRDGKRSEHWHHVWHPTAEQMEALLYQAGFMVAGQLNGYNFLPYDRDQPGLVWLAQRG